MALSSKDPEEIVTVVFDFAALTATVATPVVTMAVVSGTDANPSAMLSGSPTVVGAEVHQKIVGGLSGVTYSLRCRADAADGSRFVLADELIVEIG